MTIIEPSQDEKDRSIDYILSRGLTRPRTLWQHVCELHRALGLRFLFLNTAQPVIISAALMIGFTALFPLPYEQYKFAVLFAAAPIFFIFAVLLTEWAERMNALYELKMTCKYTIRQIAAFRVLCFSWIGMVLCTLAPLFIRFADIGSLLKALSLSLCSMFLFSFLAISFIRRSHSRWLHWVPVLLWTAAGPLPVMLFKTQWELFLSRLPVVLTAWIAALALVLFLQEIKKLITIPTREVAYYAGC